MGIDAEESESRSGKTRIDAIGGSRRARIVGGAILMATVLGGLLLWGVGPGGLGDAAAAAWGALRAAPAPIYFTVLSLAILGPVPVSVLFVTAGPIYGIGPSLAWIAPALAVNAVIVHAIGTSRLRPALAAWLERRGTKLPTLERRSDQLLFTVLLRVTPGIPYFVQSWSIVLAGVELRPFLLITVGIQMVYATGFVVLGRSAFEGRLGLAGVALALLVLAGFAARIVHLRLQTRPRP